jgi:hypothetical protein
MKRKARDKPSDLAASIPPVEYGVFYYQRNGCKVRAELSKRANSESAQLKAETVTAYPQ